MRWNNRAMNCGVTGWHLAMHRRGWRTSCSGQARARRPQMIKRPRNTNGDGLDTFAGVTRALVPVLLALLVSGCQSLGWGQGGGEMPAARPGTLASLSPVSQEREADLPEIEAG